MNRRFQLSRGWMYSSARGTRKYRNLTLSSLLLVSVVVLAGFQRTQHTVVFDGYPVRTVEVASDGSGVTQRPMSSEESEEFLARVVVDGEGNHFWETREMKPMVRIVSGSYVSYVATTGYIRTYTDFALGVMRAAAASGVDEAKTEYVEHLYIYLGSITYHGRRLR